MLLSLPIIGDTTMEDLAFYGVIGTVAALRWVNWPTALLLATTHGLHQRMRSVAGKEERLFDEALEGGEEALGDVI